MSNAFDLAVSAIFADANMTVSAIFKSPSKTDIPIRVVKSTTRDDSDFGDTQIFQEKTFIDVCKSDIQEPKIGDSIVIDGVLYEIYARPRIDALSLVWSCEVRS